MKSATIYYNPQCGTCRNTLDYLKKAGYDAAIVEYLKHPPAEAELDAVLRKLKMEPQGIVREKEPIFQEKFAGKTLGRAAWLKALHDHPALIQRPIVIIGEKAMVCRPAEKVLEFIKE